MENQRLLLSQDPQTNQTFRFRDSDLGEDAPPTPRLGQRAVQDYPPSDVTQLPIPLLEELSSYQHFCSSRTPPSSEMWFLQIKAVSRGVGGVTLRTCVTRSFHPACVCLLNTLVLDADKQAQSDLHANQRVAESSACTEDSGSLKMGLKSSNSPGSGMVRADDHGALIQNDLLVSC